MVIAEIEGYRKRWYLVTSSERLAGLDVVEVFAARFRQEDAFRDLKQRLGGGGMSGLDEGADRADVSGPDGGVDGAAAAGGAP